MTQGPSSPHASVFHRYLESQDVPELAERILDAAMRLFARKGYAATSVREIVQEARVTNPMLYYYFTNKEGVFTRLIDLLFGVMEQIIARAMTQERELMPRLTLILDEHLRGVHEAPDALRFVYAAVFGPRESCPEFGLNERRMISLAQLQGAFQAALDAGELEAAPGVDAWRMAQHFLGMLNTHMMEILALQDMGPELSHLIPHYLGPEARDQLLRLFFAGVGAAAQEQSR